MRVCSTTRVAKHSGLGGSIRKEGCFINYIPVAIRNFAVMR